MNRPREIFSLPVFQHPPLLTIRTCQAHGNNSVASRVVTPSRGCRKAAIAHVEQPPLRMSNTRHCGCRTAATADVARLPLLTKHPCTRI